MASRIYFPDVAPPTDDPPIRLCPKCGAALKFFGVDGVHNPGYHCSNGDYYHRVHATPVGAKTNAKTDDEK